MPHVPAPFSSDAVPASTQPAAISQEIQSYAHGDPDFAAWLAEADSICFALFGVSILDLPDHCWADWHDDGFTPAQAVQAALENGSY